MLVIARALDAKRVRGGISIALVLSVPEFSQKPLILAATYAVVIFSILVQGLTLAPLVRKVVTAMK